MTEYEWFKKCIEVAAQAHGITTLKVLCTQWKDQRATSPAREHALKHYRELYPETSRPTISRFCRQMLDGVCTDMGLDPVNYRTLDQSSVTVIIHRYEEKDALLAADPPPPD